jgi:hypothetical protein
VTTEPSSSPLPLYKLGSLPSCHKMLEYESQQHTLRPGSKEFEEEALSAFQRL